jgi:hypothetical protein
MVYLCVNPMDGEAIIFSDIESAKIGAIELGTFFFFPRQSFCSTEKQKTVILLENHIWIQKKLIEMKCTCTSH